MSADTAPAAAQLTEEYDDRLSIKTSNVVVLEVDAYDTGHVKTKMPRIPLKPVSTPTTALTTGDYAPSGNL
jgi:hypothetical protein